MEILNHHIVWTGTRPTRVSPENETWLSAGWELSVGEDFSASCRLTLPETRNPFWCIPGLFWGDNQQDTTRQYYPRFSKSLAKPAKFESAFWEFDAWRASQPVVAVHDGNSWVVLEVAPYAQCGAKKLKASIGFEYIDGAPCLVASVPPNERPYRPVGHDYTAPVKETHTALGVEKVTWMVRAVRLEGGPRELLGFLRDNYHATSGQLQLAETGDYASAARNALMKWHYNTEGNYFRYTVAFDRVGQQIAEGAGGSLDRHEMPLGWVSGWVVFEALIEWAIKKNDPAALDAVTKTWEQLVAAGVVSPSGYWWTRFVPPRGETRTIFDSKLPGGLDGNWMTDPHHLHLRTLGDAVWRAASTLRLHGSALPFAGQLRQQVSAQALQIAKLAASGWPLPLSVDARTGEPTGLKGTAAMIWISVWSELAQMGEWEDTALIRSALDHYREAVSSGQLFGAPEDVGECVTSEDIYIAINAYFDGYRITGRQEDLDTCIRAAEWLYLWQKSFHHEFDPRTLIGAYGLRSRGGHLASFKNNHLHIYGLDADRSLRELAVITGDERWQQLADDHWAFSAQLTPLVDGQFNAYEGMVTEQFYFLDWSALGNSVRFLEADDRRAAYDVGPYGRNYGNLAGFSHAWCTAFVLRTALKRENTCRGGQT